jgi:hypothetical protein
MQESDYNQRRNQNNRGYDREKAAACSRRRAFEAKRVKPVNRELKSDRGQAGKDRVQQCLEARACA